LIEKSKTKLPNFINSELHLHWFELVFPSYQTFFTMHPKATQLKSVYSSKAMSTNSLVERSSDAMKALGFFVGKTPTYKLPSKFERELLLLVD
jgi:hypothetical protein